MSRAALTESVLRRTTSAAADDDRAYFARGVPVRVYARGTTEEADLWSAAEGGVKVGQPVLTDASGRALGPNGEYLWADRDYYDIVAAGQRIPWTEAEPGAGGEGGGGVESVNGDTGPAVTLDASDVGAATPEEVAAAVAGKQDAATAATDAELAAHASDTTAVHGISDTAALATTSAVEALIQEAIDALVDGAPEALDTLNEIGEALKAAEESDESALEALTALVEARATKVELEAHVSDSSAAHAASAISYAGNSGMSATTVEAAIDELASESDPETYTWNFQPAGAELIGLFQLWVPSGFTMKLKAMSLKVASGTVKVKVKRTTAGGSTTEPFKEKEAKSTLTEHTPTSETLADKDVIEVLSEGAAAGLLMVTLVVEKVRS